MTCPNLLEDGRPCEGENSCDACMDKELAYWAPLFKRSDENARLLVMNDNQLAEEMAEARELK